MTPFTAELEGSRGEGRLSIGGGVWLPVSFDSHAGQV